MRKTAGTLRRIAAGFLCALMLVGVTPVVADDELIAEDELIADGELAADDGLIADGELTADDGLIADGELTADDERIAGDGLTADDGLIADGELTADDERIAGDGLTADDERIAGDELTALPEEIESAEDVWMLEAAGRAEIASATTRFQISGEHTVFAVERGVGSAVTYIENSATARSVIVVFAAYDGDGRMRAVMPEFVSLPSGRGKTVRFDGFRFRGDTDGMTAKFLVLNDSFQPLLSYAEPTVYSKRAEVRAALTPEEEEEAGIVKILRAMVDNYYGKKIYNKTESAKIRRLTNKIYGILRDALNRKDSEGILLDRDFIDAEYGEEIDQSRTTYNNFTDDQKTTTKTLVWYTADEDKVRTVFEYFGFNVAS